MQRHTITGEETYARAPKEKVASSMLDQAVLLAADVVGDLLAVLGVGGGHLHVVAGLLLAAGAARFATAVAVAVDGVQDQLHGAQKAPAPVGDLHALTRHASMSLWFNEACAIEGGVSARAWALPRRLGTAHLIYSTTSRWQWHPRARRARMWLQSADCARACSPYITMPLGLARIRYAGRSRACIQQQSQRGGDDDNGTLTAN